MSTPSVTGEELLQRLERRREVARYLPALRLVYRGWWVIFRDRCVRDADRDLHALMTRHPKDAECLVFVGGFPVAPEDQVRRALTAHHGGCHQRRDRESR